MAHIGRHGQLLSNDMLLTYVYRLYSFFLSFFFMIIIGLHCYAMKVIICVTVRAGRDRGLCLTIACPKIAKNSYWISKTLKKYGHAIACYMLYKSIDLL